MGFDISKSALIKDKNILLEGISDYYYLNAFKSILKQEKDFEDVAFIPCVGASKIPQLASLCIGWGLKYVALFDNDKEGQRTDKELKQELGNLASTVFICEIKDCAIEDLFTKDDFNKFVLTDSDGNNTEDELTNSAYLKKNKSNKVLIAKLFYDKVKNAKSKMAFSKETLTNFKELFKTLSAKLKD
jgi:predicted ATP-dependent endonuclease of OLD family